jgi:hypothetical protein
VVSSFYVMSLSSLCCDGSPTAHADARLRGDARGRDGGICKELAAGIGVAEGAAKEVRIARECSGDLLPPSPPAEQTTARQDQAGEASTARRRTARAPTAATAAAVVSAEAKTETGRGESNAPWARRRARSALMTCAAAACATVLAGRKQNAAI